MEDMPINWGVGWNGLGKVGRFFLVVKIGGGYREEVAICSWAIKFDHSARSPTSLTPQSNSNDVGNSNGSDCYGKKVVGKQR